MRSMLSLGAMVTDFLLPDQLGREVCLFDELAQRRIVLTFYTKDATFG